MNMAEILAIDLHEADVGVCAKCGTVMDICAECLDTDNFLQNLPREAFFNTYQEKET